VKSSQNSRLVDTIRISLIFITLMAMSIINFYAYSYHFLINPNAISEDLATFVSATNFLLKGMSPYSIPEFAYMPQSIIYYVPLAFFQDLSLASKIFFLVNIGLIVIIGLLMNRASKKNDFISIIFGQLILFSAGFTHHNLSHGQSDFLLILFLMIGVLLSEANRYWLSGVAFFLGGIVKHPLTSLLLSFYISFSKRKWGVLISFLLLFIISSFLILLIYGPQIFVMYLKKVSIWLEWQGGYNMLNLYENRVSYLIFIAAVLICTFYITLYKRIGDEFSIPLIVASSFLLLPFFPSHQIIVLIPFFFPLMIRALSNQDFRILFFILTYAAILLICFQPLIFTGRRTIILYLLFYEAAIYFLTRSY